ncbi:HAD family hydrolase [Planococcus sp. S3-L1]|uniref:HAD family hydrolase n=1 Tax=Planococcus sp. S3-L1 TaxID=3046200 RepID=UPI0024B8A8DF|nr:HAD family hydrolase [Planococcus sp. S3-L1]MDJ0332870.1 HAD family hydrolase [Planococcus sp. S3-L1]
MIFDLDDTLLDRNQAVNNLFSILIEDFYENVKEINKKEMLKKFKEYDKRNYGNGDKTRVLEPFFDEFPTESRLHRNDMLDFWNTNFPNCFSANQNTIDIVNTIKKQVKIAIITNGATKRQKAKMSKSKLDRCFDKVIISEEVGFSKPDEQIFEMALKNLNVKPEEALFVGDDLVKDIGGCQNVNIKGIWFNPQSIKNNTAIKPYGEINSLDRLLSYLT